MIVPGHTPANAGPDDQRASLIVFDEAGSSSHPGDLRQLHDFAVCGLMVTSDQIADLRRLHEQLVAATGKSDFKFADVRHQPRAAASFRTGMQRARFELLAFYCAPGSVAMDQRRFLAQIEQDLGPPLPGTAESPRTMHQNFLRIVELVASALVTRAQEGFRMEAYWDRRSDHQAIMAAWQEEVRQHRRNGFLPDDCPEPTLTVGLPGELAFLARLAGIVAGDLVAMFRHTGPRIFALIREGFFVDRRAPEGRRIVGHQPIARMKAPLIRPATDETGEDGTMLRSYYRRLLKQQVFFFDPSGRGCGLRIRSNTDWEVLQVPDPVQSTP